MSEIWLILSVLSLGLSIILVGVYIDQGRAEKQRAVRLLETQVIGPSGVASDAPNLREQELEQDFASRVLVPVVSRAGRFARRVTPIDARDRIDKKLLLAGSPVGWDAERVLAFKIIGAVAGFILSLVIFQLISLSPFIQIVATALLTFCGFIAPDSILNSKVEDRKKEILKTLSDTLDLLTISVEAGLGFEQALDRVINAVPGPLSDEFARMLGEVRAGANRADAMRAMDDRCNVAELRSFVLAILQADTFGVSIGRVLRAQAEEMRIKRRQLAQEKAQKAPVKMLIPMVFCIFPALFVIVLGPAVINIYQKF